MLSGGFLRASSYFYGYDALLEYLSVILFVCVSPVAGISTFFLSLLPQVVDFPWKSGDFWLSAHI